MRSIALFAVRAVRHTAAIVFVCADWLGDVLEDDGDELAKGGG